MLMLAVSAMFAQQKPVFKAIPNPTESPKIAQEFLDTKAGEKPGQNGWFNYAQGMAIYMYGEEYGSYMSTMGHGMPMLAD
ncbi:MAG: hypothetical protein J5719_05830, partial [Bacteroidales bacterium]|nr:hypothetical protein [Bacteroidales bacterium]